MQTQNREVRKGAAGRVRTEISESVERMTDANKSEKMDTVLRAVRASVTQGIMLRGFGLSILVTALIMNIGVWEKILSSFETEGLLPGDFHFQILQEGMQSEWFAFVLPILSTVPCSAIFLEELQTGFMKAYLPRTSKSGYIIGKIGGCAFLGGIAAVCGIILAMGIDLLIYLPREKVLEETAGHTEAWGMFLQNLLLIFCIGMFWALFGMLMSIVTNSKYMAYISPFILYYVLIIMCERYFKSCYVFYPAEWMKPELFPGGCYGVMLFICELSAVVSLFFYRLAKDRAENL